MHSEFLQIGTHWDSIFAAPELLQIDIVLLSQEKQSAS